MNIVLQPLSHPELGTISIGDTLFAIGRAEEPFASKAGAAASQLSRRHARIFKEDGQAFIADLGSLNGTSVNDRPVSGVVPLQNGDVIALGGTLSFSVHLELDGKVEQPALPIRLTLVPQDPLLEAISIDRFPFLVSRSEGAFGLYAKEYGQDLRMLSRRHALFALRGDEIYVEDLDSANGTFVGEERLDERARLLAEGEQICFGGGRFTYRVHIEKPTPATAAEPAPEPVPAPPPTATPDRTRFVSSATSFLDIFCDQESGSDPANKSTDAAETVVVPSLKSPTRSWRLRALFQRIWFAATGNSQVDRRVAWSIAGVVAVILIAVAANYALGWDRRSIKSELDDGDYAASVAAANRYLKNHPDDQQAGNWGEEALIKSFVPNWVKAVEAQQFDAAAKQAEAAKTATFDRGVQLLDTLSWMGRVDAYVSRRGGADAPLMMFKDEDTVSALVRDWEADSFGHQQRIDRIAALEPSFDPVQRRVFSDLRALRSDNTLYVSAISKLKKAIRDGLDSGDRAAIGAAMTEFVTGYPRVRGVDALKKDLDDYDKLVVLVEQKDLGAIVRMRNATQFRTPLFRDHVQQWLSATLPPPNVIDLYESAKQAWRKGEREEAVVLLEQATSQPWGEAATRQIARYRQIESDYVALQAAQGSPQYRELLLAFWGSLQPDDDQHLIEEIRPKFMQYKDEVLARLQQSQSRASATWKSYKDAGGIQGVLRVEARVSDRFATQAKRLSDAYRDVANNGRTYRLLQMEQPEAARDLQVDVTNEVVRQRRWLQDLNIVLEPALLRAKLALLPESPEQEQVP